MGTTDVIIVCFVSTMGGDGSTPKIFAQPGAESSGDVIQLVIQLAETKTQLNVRATNKIASNFMVLLDRAIFRSIFVFEKCSITDRFQYEWLHFYSSPDH